MDDVPKIPFWSDMAYRTLEGKSSIAAVCKEAKKQQKVLQKQLKVLPRMGTLPFLFPDSWLFWYWRWHWCCSCCRCCCCQPLFSCIAKMVLLAYFTIFTVLISGLGDNPPLFSENLPVKSLSPANNKTGCPGDP